MTLSERDSKKDTRTDGATNYSAFNMNLAMLKQLGATNDCLNEMNSSDTYDKSVEYARMGLARFGVKGFLDFHRGGETAYNNGGQGFMCDVFRNAVKTALIQISKDKSLLTDDRRVCMNVPYV